MNDKAWVITFNENEMGRGPACAAALRLLDTIKGMLTERAWSHPPFEDELRSIASLWGKLLGQELSHHQVALMLVNMKVARALHRPENIDHWLDIAGYALLYGGMITMENYGKKTTGTDQ